MVLTVPSEGLCWIPACDCPRGRGFIYLLIFLQKNVLEDPSTSALRKAEWAVVDLHRLIQIPFGDLQLFYSISFLPCKFPLKTCHEAVPVCTCPSSLGSVGAWFSWPAQGALWSSSSTQLRDICALDLEAGNFRLFPHSPPHTLLRLITELLGLSCCHETSAPIFMWCLCTVVTGRVLQSCPTFWMFFTSLTVL